MRVLINNEKHGRSIIPHGVVNAHVLNQSRNLSLNHLLA